MVEAIVDSIVEEVYKKASRDMGAERMVVSERRIVPSDVGIRFYISTLHFINNVPLVMASIHTVPFEKPYMITFTMVTPLDKTATKDNEVITQVFSIC